MLFSSLGLNNLFPGVYFALLEQFSMSHLSANLKMLFATNSR